MLTHTSLIDRYEPPQYFRDVMTRGGFMSFEHEHFFNVAPQGGTLMRDRLLFSAPLGPLGRIAEALVLRKYLTGFLVQRNEAIKSAAERKEVWKRYIE